ncbi:hypothetical protein [Leifsonia poae]|uniref:hypothetical protein n=1 Tax=Leifsonia poae TaxID=110933 RepID=UPI001CBDC86E|nr:hypothetical protein [Leifsonia poae]
MAGLNWARLDANFSSNHKTLALLGTKGGDHAALVYVFSLGYCAFNGTDGFIPKAAPGTFHGTAKDATLLVEVGLWKPIDGGWDVNDWAEYQPTTEESRARSDRARKAAAKRWGTDG